MTHTISKQELFVALVTTVKYCHKEIYYRYCRGPRYASETRYYKKFETIFLGGNLPRGHFSGWQFSWGAYFRGAIFSGTYFPGAFFRTPKLIYSIHPLIRICKGPYILLELGYDRKNREF